MHGDGCDQQTAKHTVVLQCTHAGLRQAVEKRSQDKRSRDMPLRVRPQMHSKNMSRVSIYSLLTRI